MTPGRPSDESSLVIARRKRNALWLAAFLAAICPSKPVIADTVVLLHGLGRSPRSMARLAGDLRAAGYEVRNIGYPSQSDDIVSLAEAALGPVFANATTERIHVVTHSMGGILLRQYLHAHGVPSSLGRVVMLAPPNKGSPLVDRLAGWPFYRWVNGPAGLQLGATAGSVPNTLGPIPAGVELGVIAGDRSLNPLFSAWLDGPDDGKVSVASTHLEGESGHLTVPCSHTWIMWRKPVMTAVRAFLRDGRFPSA